MYATIFLVRYFFLRGNANCFRTVTDQTKGIFFQKKKIFALETSTKFYSLEIILNKF